MFPLCFNAFNGSPWFGAGVPLRAQIDAAAAAGFAAIGLDRYSLDAFAAAGGRIADAERWLREAGIGCGAITALVVFSRDTVQWRNLAHEFPWEDPTPSEFENPPVSFVFDRQQYTDLLLSLRARFDPDLATDPADLVPRADEVVDSRHTRHIWCWFSRAGDVDPRGKGGRT